MDTFLVKQPLIVIPAYRRAASLLRLLNSIANAHIPESGIRVLVSIDGGGTTEVEKVAKSFKIHDKEIDVVVHPNNMGLRNHIIWCGSLTSEHESVIILEDDLVVDPWFYKYATEVIGFYGDNPNLAGYALYAHKYNDYAEVPFVPFRNGYSTYFMQVGCSWGQIWTRAQWQGFMEWYARMDETTIQACKRLPDNVKRWSKESWKKYFNTYIIDTDKYIVYPYETYSTNCSDSPGVHIREGINVFQVNFRSPDREMEALKFADFDKKEICYDSYLEPCGSFIFKALKLHPDEVEIDLHGHKNWELLQSKKFVLTVRNLKAREVKRFPLSFRPVEMNFVYESFMENSTAIRLFEMSDNIAPTKIQVEEYFYLTSYYSDFDTRNMKYARGYFMEFWRTFKKFYLRR